MVASKDSLSDDEVKSLGLMCGLEIHQQLEGRKLFCRCPTTIRDDKPHFTIRRFLRASAGESGVVDAAALAEMLKNKGNIYEGYLDSTCLVELDEEPPGDVDIASLHASLQVAKLLGMRLVDQVRFMRKTVVDGSNTSGFQRTALVAVDGLLKTPAGLVVGIDSLCLEEDAAKKVRSSAEAEVYNLSRLGIPLIEIATAPDMRSPLEVREVAESLGMVLRSLPVTKRGLGTIRQDVNVSIRDGVRVEIKGAQDLKLLPTLVEFEALRQRNLLEVFAELARRKARVGGIVDVTDLCKDVDSKVIRSALKSASGVVLAAPLYGFGGLTGLQVQPGRRFGSELSDHAKVMGVKGLFHADELPAYGIDQSCKDALFKRLKLDAAVDNFLLVAADELVARRALQAACDRAGDFSLRQEVRVALPSGASSYMRPMPGSARMYPETDVLPVLVANEDVVVPRLLSERIGELAKKYGLAKDVAKRLLRDGIDLDVLTAKFPNVKPAFIVDLFFSTPSLIKKKSDLDVDISLFADELLAKLNDGVISKDAVVEVATLLAKGVPVDYEMFKPMDVSVIDAAVKQAIASDPAAPLGALMGVVMKKLQGKADGSLVMQRLQALKK